MDDQDRFGLFWQKVNITDPSKCWVWTAGTNRYGYGAFFWSGAMRGGHRIAYEWLIGLIPPDMTIDHLCCNRACVNPTHMEIVTRGENAKRAMASMTHCRRGHAFTKENTLVYAAPG